MYTNCFNIFIISFLLIWIMCFNSQGASFNKVNGGGVFNFFNKSTGKYETADIKIGDVYKFDNDLSVLFRACYKSSSQDEPENIAFLQVSKVVPKNDKSTINLIPTIAIPEQILVNPQDGFETRFIFSGWLFSSSPSVNTVVDVIYDISLIKCYFDN